MALIAQPTLQQRLGATQTYRAETVGQARAYTKHILSTAKLSSAYTPTLASLEEL